MAADEISVQWFLFGEAQDKFFLKNSCPNQIPVYSASPIVSMRNARMKKVEAIIKPFKLEEVKEALAGVGVERRTLRQPQRRVRERGARVRVARRQREAERLPHADAVVVDVQRRRPIDVVDGERARTCAVDVGDVKGTQLDRAPTPSEHGEGRWFTDVVDDERQGVRAREDRAVEQAIVFAQEVAAQ